MTPIEPIPWSCNARTDRLALEEKTLVQQLAVIGREFPLSLARQVVSRSEEELYRLLAALQRKEFLYEQPAFPEVEYHFKHALTQEVAYGTVLQEERRALHERTAQVIEALYSASLDEHYSELANHYSRSRNTPKAIDYRYRAGQQAVQRSATTEAITHFTTALELLQASAETPERAHQELTLQLSLAPPLTVTKGYTAPEVGVVFTRALELCRQIGDTPQLFPALWGATNFYLLRGELQTAREVAERLLPLAQQAQEPALLQEAHGILGLVLMVSGETVAARPHYEQALALYDAKQRYTAIARYGADVGVWRLSQLAHVLWLLGYPDQALQRNRAALTLAQELAHPYTTASAWLNDTMLSQFLQEAQAVRQRADALLALSEEHGFSLYLAVADGFRGWALQYQSDRLGQTEEGIQQIRQSIAATRAIGTEAFKPYFLALLAEAQGKTGCGEGELTALDEALEVVERTGVRLGEAEIYRLRGELTLQQQSRERRAESMEQKSDQPNPYCQISDPESEAEAYFLKAIEVARRQHTKSWELRAIVSLSRLWQRQGKKAEAHQMLSEVYNWFTEGFDTKDLQEAKALLAELSH